MSDEEFKREIAKARKLVASWPAWKRGILEQSMRPTVSTPRKPVFNKCPTCGR